MTFNLTDWLGNPQNMTDYLFYNDTQLLTYTEGTYELTDGTYTIWIYWKTYLIYTKALSTATYGNTTVTITLAMKPITRIFNGYIIADFTPTIFNKNLDIPEATVFTLAGPSGTHHIYVNIDNNAYNINLDEVNVTSWVYVDDGGYGYIDITTTTLGTFAIARQEGAADNPGWGDGWGSGSHFQFGQIVDRKRSKKGSLGEIGVGIPAVTK
jgi:hypothetical protein